MALAPQLERPRDGMVPHTHTQAESLEADDHRCTHKLPRQFGAAELRRRFPNATADETLYGEDGQTPEAELADPVPLLERRQWGSPIGSSSL